MHRRDGNINTAGYWFESVPLVRFVQSVVWGRLDPTWNPAYHIITSVPERHTRLSEPSRELTAIGPYSPYRCLMAANRDHHSSEIVSITLHRMPRQAWRKALSPRQANHTCRRILYVRPLYVPGAQGAFHANLQATRDVYLYLSHALVSLLPWKLRTPK